MRAVQCLAGFDCVTAHDVPSGPSNILSFHLPAPTVYSAQHVRTRSSVCLSVSGLVEAECYAVSSVFHRSAEVKEPWLETFQG
jgi:hypothetical protein